MVQPFKPRAYGQNQPLIDIFPFPISRTSAPGVTDTNFLIGQVWIYESGNARTVYMYGGLNSSQEAIWALLAQGDSDLETLTGDSGGAISPSSGNITLAGGTNITSSGASSTITFDLNDAVTLATSIDVPLITATGAALDIHADTNQNINIRMGNDTTASFHVRNQSSSNIFHVNGTLISMDVDAEAVGDLSLVTAGKKLSIVGGAATDFIGTATLTSGTVTIANTNIAASDRIFIQRSSTNSSTQIGFLVYSISAGASFTITSENTASPGSTQTNDHSIVSYVIIRQGS